MANCDVKSLARSNLKGLKIYSPDGTKYLINQEDENGIAQIYVGQAGEDPICATHTKVSGGPSVDRFKMQVKWHPSGKWIVCAVEREVGDYDPGLAVLLGRGFIEGILQCGIWTNMWAMSPDGSKWRRLTNYKSGLLASWFGIPDGFTGPAFTPDGKKGVWSEAMGDMGNYKPFGKWRLVIADWTETGWINKKTITPIGMDWNEPGNFHPNGEDVLLTGGYDKTNQEKMEQYILNIRTKAVTPVTNYGVWSEHGVFSPNGEKILFMSSVPYDSPAHTMLGIKTEFMLVDADGKSLTQLTKFRTPGSPEHHNGMAAIGEWSRDGLGLQLLTLEFPNYHVWNLDFEGVCGV